ncbi:MAG: SAM-dependent methyltransferase [Flavobacteriales bacterium]|nr:SAM-dependent methyltransferase [Flavobacteriales bacterium]|tara:strand:- start:7555 stop:8178 length:624 start_codon:yes stop_codon:yes gene_type:complete
MGIYQKYIMPKVLDFLCSTKPIQYQRKKVVHQAYGNILEIGIGTGNNIPFYDKSKVSKIIGLDPSENLSKIAKIKSQKYNLKIEHLKNYAEDLDLKDETIDSVLITYTLCSIENEEKSLSEIKRVLKPDGILIFCEHGLAPDYKISKWQNLLTPISKKLAGGCCLNKNIYNLIQNNGFKFENINKMYIPSTLSLYAYQYWGIAKKNI